MLLPLVIYVQINNIIDFIVEFCNF